MALRVHNTLTGKLEEFAPVKDDGTVGMYVCGINTYDDSHMGHAKAAVTFDIIRRHVEKKGYRVTYVINFTDIEDHCIQRTIELGWPLEKLTEKYINEYFKDMAALGVRKADIYPVASHHMDDIIAAIEKLIDKGMAYESGGDVYFRVAKVKDYGKLSKQKLDDMQAGARIDVDDKKENPMDFTLWKAKKEGEPFWESPWSEGRPGWHIECSVMSMKYLGSTFDLHGGGTELVFPHHENEIIQSEAISGEQPFVKYWLHGGLMNVGDEKMSKSLNNFFTIKDVLKIYPAMVVRFFLLNTHYRKPIDFNSDALDEAKKSLDRLQNSLDNLKREMPRADADAEDGMADVAQVFMDRFEKAMDNDFNTRDAIAVMFDFAKEVNKYANSTTLSKKSAEAIIEVFDEVDDRLSIFRKPEELDDDFAAEVEALIKQRDEARADKDWATADSIRDKLNEMGVVIEDGSDGVKWRMKK